jgi:hypothetical protein
LVVNGLLRDDREPNQPPLHARPIEWKDICICFFPPRNRLAPCGFTIAFTESGLPDFSWSNIPKRGKIYQITIQFTKWQRNIPNGRKIDQMASKYTNIFHCKSPPKYTQIGIYGFKNMPSSNTALNGLPVQPVTDHGVLLLAKY